MNNGVDGSKSELKRAEHHVFSELLKRGLLPYRIAGGGLWVNTPTGCRLELRPVSSTGNGAGEEGRFAVADFQPRPELFFLCVEFDGDDIAAVWVLPSIPFFVYSDADEPGGTLELNLDAKLERYSDQSFREYNSCFRNRWDSIVQFDYFRRYMPPMGAPGFQRSWEDFEDIMMLMEESESRKWAPEESIPFDLSEDDEPDGDGRYKIRFSSREVLEQLESIPPDDYPEVEAAILSLADNPRPSGVIGLEGTPGNYRVRIIP